MDVSFTDQDLASLEDLFTELYLMSAAEEDSYAVGVANELLRAVLDQRYGVAALSRDHLEDIAHLLQQIASRLPETSPTREEYRRLQTKALILLNTVS